MRMRSSCGVPAATSFRTSSVNPFSMNRAGPKKAGTTSVCVSLGLDDETLVGLVVLALLGREEARADVAQLCPERERAREGDPVDDPAGADHRDVDRVPHGGREDEAVHGLVAHVAGCLEPGRDHARPFPRPAR